MPFFKKKKSAEEKNLQKQQRELKAAEKEAKKGEAKKGKERLKASQENQKPSSNKIRPYFCKIDWPLSGGIGQCYGCKFEIDKVFTQHRDGIAISRQQPIAFHDNFQQLRACALDCASCRVFERALVKAQSTKDDELLLEKSDTATNAVTARLVANEQDGKSRDLLLEITIKGAVGPTWQAHIACTRAKGLEYLKTVHIDHNHRSLYEQGQSWLESCLDDHDQCPRLFWSRNNPTRLIKILNESQVQLVDATNLPTLRYVALSYCWGSFGLSDEEESLIRKGNTWTTTVDRRMAPFDVAEFPQTILDTITFVRRMGIEYVWIDAVCIIQDSPPNGDKDREMSRMHEYYGNALFTLCLSASTKSTEGFLRPRKAWRFKESDCEINGYKIFSLDTTLEHASENSPWAKRAWTLQEEHLSPRKLYWFNQSMYWSCAQSKHVEGVKEPARRPKPLRTALSLVTCTDENFLVACRKDQFSIVKSEWLRIVESYARRNMARTTDRFPAISGVASRYYKAQFGRDQYMAGLWRSSLAEQLAWQVISPASRADCDEPLRAIPSWSWASLPLKTGIHAHPSRFANPFQPSDHDLELLTDSSVSPVSTHQSSLNPEEAVAQGGEIKSVQVKGRLRPFWLAESTMKAWSEVFTTNKHGREILHPDYSGIALVHSVDVSSGRVVVAGDRMDEVYGQLDYMEDVERVGQGQLRIYALQLSSSALLLVEKCDGSRYRRVGVCHDFWSSFLADHVAVEMTLI